MLHFTNGSCSCPFECAFLEADPQIIPVFKMALGGNESLPASSNVLVGFSVAFFVGSLIMFGFIC